MSYKKQARVFKAFCDEIRLQIIELLCEGEQCACVLLEKLDVTQSGLSYHMKILVESGVVESRIDGRMTLYKISRTGCEHAKSLITELTSARHSLQTKILCSVKV